MKGEDDIRAMPAAGAPKQYFPSETPSVTSLRELRNHRRVRHIQVQRGNESLAIQNRSLA